MTTFRRDKELSILNKKLENFKNGYRQNIAILGKRHSGKSSLIQHFLSNTDVHDTVPIYVDLANMDFKGFADQFIGMMLYNNKNYASDPDVNLEQLIAEASGSLPNTHKKIKSIYQHIKNQKEKIAYNELMDLPITFSTETNKFCVIALDNFTRLLEYNLKTPFSVLGEKIMLQKMSMYILADRQTLFSRKVLSEELTLLFGKLYNINLKPLSVQESLEYIDMNCGAPKLFLQFKQFLAHITNGEPFYLNVFSESMTEIAGENDFCKILSEAICGRFSQINMFFSGIVQKASPGDDFRITLKLLYAILHQNKINSIIENAKCTRKHAYKLLDRFIAQDVVIKNGPLYAIEDEIFKAWIRIMDKEISPRLRIKKDDSADFAFNHIKALLYDFRRELLNPPDDKIYKLLSTFDNEKITVNKRTHILPAFDRVESEHVNKDDFVLSARGAKYWAFSVFRQHVDEDNVLDFVSHYRNDSDKIDKKVLIHFTGISPEAKLLAMEEGMWIWPLDKLNGLLNLYRKPKINIV